jgi:Domain of unknown function (DUF4440)
MTIEDEIAGLLKEKALALVSRSRAQLEELLDQDFVYINTRGDILDRRGYIALFCDDGGVRVTRQACKIRQLCELGAAVTAVVDLDDAFEIEGTIASGRHRSLCVFTRYGDRWVWSAGQTMALPGGG